MNLGIRIKRLCEERNMSIRKLAIKIGIAEQTLHRNIKRGSMETKYLVLMSKVFNVEPSYFLQNDPSIPIMAEDSINEYKIEPGNKYQELLEEIREVNKENRELNKRIREMEDHLTILKTEKHCADQKSGISE